MKLRTYRLPLAAAALVLASASAAWADDLSSAAVGQEVLAALGATPLAGAEMASVTGLGADAGLSIENVGIAVSKNVMTQNAFQMNRSWGGGVMEAGDISIGDNNSIINSAVNVNTGFNAVQGAQRSSSLAIGSLE